MPIKIYNDILVVRV